MAWTWKKTLIVAGVGTVGGIACFLTAGAAAPALGALIGSSLGLSGAAATSAGLAAVGGGALAAGGAGVAGGTALIAGTAAAVGAGAAAAGAAAACAATKEEKRCSQCDGLVEPSDNVCSNCGRSLT